MVLHSIDIWKLICNYSWDGIAVTDNQGRIQWSNPAFQQITGYYECQPLLLTIPALSFPSQSKPDNDPFLLHQILSSSRWEGEVLLQMQNNSWQPVFVRKESLPGREVDPRYLWIFRDLKEIRSLQEKLVISKNYHPLTTLPNRIFLTNRLEHRIEQARRDNAFVGLLYINLDQFKRINTSVGPVAGDELLILVSRRLQNTTRKADTLAHLDGDAFAVILEKLLQPREAATVANRIIAELSRPFTLREKKIYVNASIGISVYPLDANDCETLLQHAEEAMHAQKDFPESSYQFYDRKQDGAALALLRFETDLRQAVKNQEFSLAFQPQVRLPGRTMRGVEALARWQSPVRGIVSPRQFIPVAEKTGLICSLGHWVLENACHRAASWQGYCAPDTCIIAVNVSGVQFLEPGFLDQVQNSLVQSRLPPQCLELEVTESTLIQDKLKVADTLQALRDIGVRIAIDDFGTGQSCLAILRDLPVDTLKIDRKFLRHVPQCTQSTKLLATILDIQHALNLEIIVEGVETKEQLDFLHDQGCQVIQGFFFSPPLVESDLAGFCQSLNTPMDSPSLGVPSC